MGTIPEALAVAIKHHQDGRLHAAEQIYRQILKSEPDQSDALHLLGVIAAQCGQHDMAVAFMGRATQVEPHNAKAHNNLGKELKDLGKLDEAVARFRLAVELEPDFAEAHNNLGTILRDQGKLDEAVGCYQQALRLKPDYAEAHNNLGNALKDQGKLDEAIGSYHRALQLQADYAKAHNNLGVALLDLRKLDEAIACFRRALELKPDFAEAHNSLGVALHDRGKLDDAVHSYRQALRLNPEYADAHNNLGTALQDQGSLDEAAAFFRRAQELKPAFVDPHLNQSLLSLLTGDYTRGWAEYEWRWQTKQYHQRNFTQPRWDGQPFGGRTILLHAEQGLGDSLQFIRYASPVKERGGRVVLECQPALVPLLAGCPDIDEVVAQGDPLPAFEVEAPLLSLPGILGTTLDSIPPRVPYLWADAELTQFWRKQLEPLGGFKVGIVWQGNPQFKGDRQRSIPLRHFEALARVEGVRLVSLQKGPAADQLLAFSALFPVLDLGQHLESFSVTAAVLNNLDLLISSCTSVPHLAGALGVPVWLGLAYASDWRWLLGREDSPWYPHHRLFRQDRPGDWCDVFERIANALHGLVANRTGK